MTTRILDAVAAFFAAAVLFAIAVMASIP